METALRENTDEALKLAYLKLRMMGALHDEEEDLVFQELKAEV